MGWSSSSDIKTDLTTYYYNHNCGNIIKSKIRYLNCEDVYSALECCYNEIDHIYNKTYNFNECYNINNTFVEFGCDEEKIKDFVTTLIIAFGLSFIMCLCIAIYELNKLEYFTCKKERTFSNHLIVNQNPTYGT